MPETEPIALIDLDGTVADFDGALRRRLREIANPLETTDNATLDRLRKEPWMAARRKLIKSQPGFWRDLPVLGGGMDVVRMLRDLEFRLMVLTKGPAKMSSAWTEKVDWTRQHLPDAGITVTEDKGLVYGRVLFDDWPDYIRLWLKWRPRGLVIMTHQLWNQDYEHPNIFRFNHPDMRGQPAWRKHLNELRERLKEARER